jgi:hypothetical protein
MFHIAFGDFQVPIYLVFNCAEQETLFVYFLVSGTFRTSKGLNISWGSFFQEFKQLEKKKWTRRPRRPKIGPTTWAALQAAWWGPSRPSWLLLPHSWWPRTLLDLKRLYMPSGILFRGRRRRRSKTKKQRDRSPSPEEFTVRETPPESPPIGSTPSGVIIFFFIDIFIQSPL